MNEKINPKELTNEELDKLLDETDWCNKELLHEHDERLKSGRIKSRGILTKEELEEYFQKRQEERETKQKKAS